MGIDFMAGYGAGTLMTLMFMYVGYRVRKED